MFFAFVLASFVGACVAQTFSCAWPSLQTGDNTEDQCSLFPGYPQQFGDVQVTVAYTQEWGAASLPNVNVVAPTIWESLRDSLDYYGTFASLPDEILVILTTEDDYPISAATYFPVIKTPPCQITTYQRYTDDLANNESRALQVLAHELYHCVVQYAMGPSGGWIIEGSANFFSNLVYPDSNVEWPGTEYKYNPSLPIYAQDGRDAYTTSLFFQAQEQSQGIVNINNWVIQNAPRTPPASPDAERTRESAIPGFIDLFYLFTEQFSLKQIQDSSGAYIPNLPDITPTPAPISVNGDGTVGTATLQTVPFTITTFELDLDPGQTAVLYSNANGNQRVAYQQAGATYWSDMPSGPASGSAGYTVIPCNDNGTPTSIIVLFVSTADADTDAVQVTIEQQATDPSCTCQQSGGNKRRRRGLQRRGLTDCTNPGQTGPSQNGNGTCQATSIATDPCLAKTWTLDLPALESLMKSKLAIPGTTINSISLSGSGQLTIDGTNAAFVYSDFEVDIDITADGIDIPTSTVINGDFAAYLYMQSGGSGSGTFCLVEYQGEGSADETDPITGGFSIDLGPGGGFVTSEMIMSYTCDSNSLQMEGTLNGQLAIGPYAYGS